jgi:phospholipid/cholesterol/gamma-HCH transport system ATP-binding protein
VLELEGARLDAPTGDPGAALRISLTVAAGEAVLVHCANGRSRALLADACVGLALPAEGAVRFLGLDWSALDAGEVNALRALVGRVFYGPNWIDHLDLAENVLLPLLHHTRRPASRLLAEAADLARRFGLPGLPTGMPLDLERSDLQRAACVRAFLGSPRLVVLDHPTSGVYPALLAPLAGAMRSARERGAAVLWLTPSEVVWRDLTLPVSRRLRLMGPALVGVEAA